MEKTLNWLITSSKDPKALSLTIRGALLALAPIAIYAFGLTEADFNGLVEAIVNIVFFLTSAFSAFMTVWGLLRKVQAGRWSALK